MQIIENIVAAKLRELVRGDVLVDPKSLGRFSRDQSIYEIKPLLVVLPEDIEDVLAIVRFARDEGVPITCRAGGSGTAGSALGRGIVLALPKNEFWSRISGFSAKARTATVSAAAGVYHNELQEFLKDHGFFLPADVTSAAISRIGGNIATRASGPHALKYGSIDRFLESVELVTAGGDVINTADETSIPQSLKNKLADLERKISKDRVSVRALEARKRFKTASGYNLSAFLDGLTAGQLILHLVAGSVGTLGFITRATLRAELLEPERAVVLLLFDDLAEAGRAVTVLRDLDAAAIELVSRETLQIIRDLPNANRKWTRRLARDAHLLLVEFSGSELTDKVQQAVTVLQQSGLKMPEPLSVAQSVCEMQSLWELRKQVLWLIEHPKPGMRALAVVNDVGVPPEHLSAFITEVQQVFERHGVISPIYGHAGNGNLHLRPLFDTSLPDLPGRVRRLADDVYETVLRYGGTVTAEHGMGRLRAPYLKREWGEALYGYMREVKNIFDPGDLFNPGAMFNDAPITDNMRPDLLES